MERQTGGQRVGEHHAVGAGAAGHGVLDDVGEGNDVTRLNVRGLVRHLGDSQIGLKNRHFGFMHRRRIGDAGQLEGGRGRVGDHHALLYIHPVRHHHGDVHREGRGLTNHLRFEGEHAGCRIPTRAGNIARKGIVHRRAKAQPLRQRIEHRHIAETAAKVERLDAVNQVFPHARIALDARRRRVFFVIAHSLGQFQTRRREAVLVERVILPVHRPQRGPLHGIGQRVVAQRIGEGATRRDGVVVAIAHHFRQRGQRAAVRRGLRGKVDFDDVIDRVQHHAREVEQEVRVPHLLHRHDIRAGRDDVAGHVSHIRPALAQQHARINPVGVHRFGVVDNRHREVDHFAVGHNRTVGLQINVQVRNVRIGVSGPRYGFWGAAQVGKRHEIAGQEGNRRPLLRILEVEVGRIRQTIQILARAPQRPRHHKPAVLAQIEVVNAVAGIILGVGGAAGALGAEVNGRMRAHRASVVGHNEFRAARIELARHRRPREDVSCGRPFLVIKHGRRRSAAVGHHHGLGATADGQLQLAINSRRLQARRGHDGCLIADLDAGIRFRTTIIQLGLVDDGGFASHHLGRHQNRDGAFGLLIRRQPIARLGQQIGDAPLQGLATRSRTRHAVRRNRSAHIIHGGWQHISQLEIRHRRIRGGIVADGDGVDHVLTHVGHGHGSGFGHHQKRLLGGQYRHNFAVGQDVIAQVGIHTFGDEPVVTGHNVTAQVHGVINRHFVRRRQRRKNGNE